MIKSLSVIIPCLNAESFIYKKVIKLSKVLKNLKIKFEIIVINDGSKDNTLREMLKLKKKLKLIKCVNYKSNKGKSYIIKKNIGKTKFNHVILVDCDLPYFQVFKVVVNKLLSGYDLVIVNRRHKKSRLQKESINTYQIVRYFIGNIIGRLSCFLLNIDISQSDTQAGLKGLRKFPKLKKLDFISEKFFLDLEIIYYYSKMKKKIFNVPVVFKIPKKSSIKIFSLKNFAIINELMRVIIALNFSNKNLQLLERTKNKNTITKNF